MNPASVENSANRPKLSELNDSDVVKGLPKSVHTSKATGLGLGLGLASARLVQPVKPVNADAEAGVSVDANVPQSVPAATDNHSAEDVTAAENVEVPVNKTIETDTEAAAIENSDQIESTSEESLPAENPSVESSVEYGDVQYNDLKNLEQTSPEAENHSKSEIKSQTEAKLDADIDKQSESNDASPINAATSEDADQDREEENQFASLGLPKGMCKQLTKIGYVEPTPIQAATIPHILQRRDVLGQAQTGTGKTAAFALPLLANIDRNQRKPQVLVLCPTRELAMQVAESFEDYAKQDKKINVVAIYGGQSYQPQIRALKSGVQIVVGTPGRVMDHMKQGTLKIDEVQCLVLDEADEMLRMGFVEDVEYVLSHTPDNRQIALFSATMPPTIREIAERYLVDPEVVKIKSKQSTADTVTQKYMVVPHHQKFETLARLLEIEDTDGVIVFTKTKVTTVELADALNRRGMSASALNGDIAQSQRERTVQQLKSRRLDVLVATDVAARGLDIDRVSHVINYDMPHDSEAYVHRIGRTGRAGREGVAILLVTPKETRALQFLQRRVGKAMTESELPSIEQLNQQRVAQFQKRIEDSFEHRDFAFFQKMLTEWAETSGKDMTQVAASLAVMAQGDQPLLLDELKRGKGKKVKKASGGGRDGYECYRVSVGRRDRIQPKNIVGAIANESGLAGNEIGRIKIFESYALVELPGGIEDEILDSLGSTKVGGRDMKIRLTDASEMDVPERRGGRPGRSGGPRGGWSGGRSNSKSGPRGNRGGFGGGRKGKRPSGNAKSGRGRREG